jgi:MFS family permease
MIGPAVAGLLTVAVGPGWVFLINTATFLAMLLSLWRIPTASLRQLPRAAAGKGRIREGLRYVRFRPDIVVVLVAVFIVGTLGLNFVLFIAAMVGTEFGLDASAFGLMNSIMAIGSVTGALLSAGRSKPRLRMIFGASAAFGVTSGLAALAPDYFWFGVALVPVGLFAITMMTSANGYVQTTTDPVMRGRVMALYMANFMGGTPIGAPFVGWVANVAGPRWSLTVAAAAGLTAALIGMIWIIRARQLRLTFNRRARGLRHFGVVSRLGDTANGAAREQDPDDAVGS